MAKVKGFTLIEMLVSMVLLSSTILIATQAYRQFVSNAQDFEQKYSHEKKRYQQTSLVKDRIALSQLYLTQMSSDFYSANATPFWLGRTDSLIAVTGASVDNPQLSATYALFIEDEQLLYCELLIEEHLPRANIPPDDLCSKPLIVKNGVESMSISYYGWGSYQDYQLSTTVYDFLEKSGKKRWFNEYLGYKTGIIPEWVEVQLILSDDTEESWLIAIQKYDDRKLRASKNDTEGF